MGKSKDIIKQPPAPTDQEPDQVEEYNRSNILQSFLLKIHGRSLIPNIWIDSHLCSFK